ncbi:carboxypeptidase-like regulatory domain-containing protein [Longispora sp. K20-0274]|uniref:carboxypeptidase-like regulatory domain-containing protein n=1 Tax=Longispora sp. K20-0274 TaxID=3088255 RepID=UPI00399B528C
MAIALLIPAGPALASPGTGTLNGHFRTAAGAPITDGGFNVTRVTDGTSYYGMLDAAGGFSVDAAPGEYVVFFSSPTKGTQYAYAAAQWGDATHFTVTEGQATTVDDVALPTGAITGTITDPAGTPVAGTQVRVEALPGGGWAGQAMTDDAGHYTLPGLHVGGYRLAVQLSPGDPGDSMSQYMPGRKSRATAGQFTVAGDQTLTVDERLLPSGILTGQIQDAAGAPLPNMSLVSVFSPGEDEARAAGYTDGTSRFRYRVFADEYQIGFQALPAMNWQYFYGTSQRADAARITVQAGGTTDVSDRVLASGVLRVTAKNAAGVPIPGVCATLGSVSNCAANNSTEVELDGVPAGPAAVTVRAPGFQASTVGVTIEKDMPTYLTTTLTDIPLVTTTVVDAAGNPVVNALACLVPVTSYRVGCGDGPATPSDAQGRLRIEATRSGDYRLFVYPPQGSGYGAQWVGATGGTGDARAAQTIHVVAPDNTAAPTVRLDLAGAVTGKVTDKATGVPLAGATVGPTTFHPGSGSGNAAVTDASGRYRLDWLGPYAWPLFITHEGHAAQWSGGVGNQTQAKQIQVVAGGTTSHNVKMSRGNTVTGTVPGQGDVRVIAVNTLTGDYMGWAISSGGHYTLQLAGPQTVRLFVDGDPEHLSAPVTLTSVDSTVTLHL